MLQDVYCKLLCQVELKKNDVQTFKVLVVVSMLPPLTRRLWMYTLYISYTYSKIDCDNMSDWWWWYDDYDDCYNDVVNAIQTSISRQYHHNWIVDNLPAASILDTDQYVSTQFVGYPIGEWLY
jgi:hypothetical protein